MKPFATLALCLTLTASAQQTFTDPANLRGERVRPLDGRELPVDQGALGLQQLLRKLNTRASLLNIVAHPDDEDGGMLTFYARGLGARVADLSLTRGEGGQNAMTGDFEDALGLLRTQELLANDRYTGVDQMFGTEVDFGFSKTKEEAFAKWTHERVLYDAVRAVRLYRPLVIVSTWTGNVTDGHGQHQVSGEIAQEVFNKAGDPTVFPEMIAEGILPWQPLKVYARVPQASITPQGLFDYATGQYTPAKFTNYVTGEVSTTPPSTDVIVHEGTPDPLLTGADGKPLSYVQFARIGLGLQKSQIPAGFRMPPAGTFDVSYHRYGSRLTQQPAHEDSFFDGIDTTILGLQEYHTFPTDIVPRLAGDIQYAMDHFDPVHPQTIAPYLAEALTVDDELIAFMERSNTDAIEKASALHELRVKRVQLNDSLVLALGLRFDATAPAENVTNGSDVEVTTVLDQKNEPAVSNIHESLITSPQQTAAERYIHDAEKLAIDGSPNPLRLRAGPSFTNVITRPFFDRDTVETPVYQTDNGLRLAPQTPPALTAWADVQSSSTTLRLGRTVHAGGQSVKFVPFVSVTTSSESQILPSTASELVVGIDLIPPSVRVKSISFGAPGWKSTALPSGEDRPGHTTLRVDAPKGRRTATLRAFVTLQDDVAYTGGFLPIGYGDLPRTNFYRPSETRIVPVDLKLPTRNRIAYLPGTGDAVPEALASIGLKPEMLTVADLTPAKLSQFDTVVLGVRTYGAHPDLHGAPTQALLDFARNGGNVVVQYQTTDFTADDAPYPLSVGRYAETVVDETAPVKLLGLCDSGTPDPWCEQSQTGQSGNFPGSISDYNLLSHPNKITTADFNNWIEERGHGFLHSWDPHYTALTETHDPGAPSEGVHPQEPQRGGLITTQLGKGRWTYVAFALYRQLPEAVPGAFRLFVNLLNP